MKGFITRSVLTLCWLSGMAAFQGCTHYHDVVDPCYPERYNSMARQEVTGAFAPQVNNGHVLDQTVWNYHFEDGTDKLTVGGQSHLTYLARRRPTPDPLVYLQTAQDIKYEVNAAEKFAGSRTELDNKRIQAVQSYLNAQSAGRNVTFQVVVHDPAEVGMAAVPVGTSIQRLHAASQGTLPAGAGAGAASASGGAGVAGAAGGGGR